MGFLGSSLLHGHGFSSPFGQPTGPTALIAPGYPLIVWLAFWCFGAFSYGSAVALIALNIVANLLTVWLVLDLVRELATESIALWIGVIAACSPTLVWMPTIFWDTNLSALLLLTPVWASIKLRATMGRKHAVVAGVYAAITGLLNPALLPTVLGIGVWKSMQGQHRVNRLVWMCICFLLLFGLWPLRNLHTLHACVLTRTTWSYELWMGNHPGGDGYLEPALFPTLNPGELARYRLIGEIQFVEEKLHLAQAFILAHPQCFAWLTIRRAIRFWLGTGNKSGSILFAVHALLTTTLGLIGLLSFRRTSRNDVVMAAFIAMLLFPLPYYLTHAEFRYRLVVDPLLLVLMGRGTQTLCAKLLGNRKTMRSFDEVPEPNLQMHTDLSPEAR